MDKSSASKGASISVICGVIGAAVFLLTGKAAAAGISSPLASPNGNLLCTIFAAGYVAFMLGIMAHKQRRR